jgi:beta-glucosidase-like glycosyl hydrolase
LTGVLRDEWGFEGTVVSDYWAVAFLHSMHRLATTAGQAGALALAAGVDIELPDTICYGSELLDLISEGTVSESLLDRAVRRVLRQKLQLGLLDPDWSAEAATRDGADIELDSARNRTLARELAERSVVLLANDGELPLGRETFRGRSVALVGPAPITR